MPITGNDFIEPIKDILGDRQVKRWVLSCEANEIVTMEVYFIDEDDFGNVVERVKQFDLVERKEQRGNGK